ncbi:MAG: preprotein translocase subunit SecE [Chitinivibrionia bacterium]|jgi:preprotein translocase subunit SecE|nr:preprotein translocase subunit SecE [Chitinivibrionia bacterium]
MQRLVKYFKDVVAEMKLVTWPTRDEVLAATVLVVVFAIVMALVVAGIDVVLERALGLVI